MKSEKIKLVGAKASNLKYLSNSPSKVETCIKQIVAEDFTVYDLELDFETETFTFYLENDNDLNEPEILQKVFKTFAIRYGPTKVGFFSYAKGRNEPTALLEKR
ncbi:hypothetical protein OR571_11530 [Psychrobacillus sp. NEAU-3TGS]|uniref:hypothetical protein n=1 Tax=Psychrobacillus sp. NEAU-3TGS TaxID=2995412 RepID=UPI002499888B|nr:hypothetical protein [Psychrobacillus sp. NEAU-3TGS]MDI2587729.1 hypothetical protein [Psychrobacillus sp. NEAU-3TGS]